MHREEFERLVQFAATGGGRFALAVVVVRGEFAVQDLVQRLEERIVPLGITLWLHSVADESEDLLAKWSAIVGQGQSGESLLICEGLGRYIVDPVSGEPRVAAALNRLNQQRDELPLRFPHHVLLLLSPEAAVAFRKNARDLADVVLSTYEFFDENSVPPTNSLMEVAYPEIDWLPDTSVTPAHLEREKALLRSVLERGADNTGTYETLHRLSRVSFSLGRFDECIGYLDKAASWARKHEDRTKLASTLLKRAQRLHFLGRHDAALADANAAAEIGDREGDLSMAVGAKSLAARVLEKQGRFLDALRLLEQEVLPRLNAASKQMDASMVKTQMASALLRLGRAKQAELLLRDEVIPYLREHADPRYLAVAQGRLGDVLQCTGRLGEALQSLRSEQLPAMEALGDLREVAIVKGKIADILRVRGELDEALKIYSDQLVPVFSLLGETWELANTYGKIAGTFALKHKWGAALQIRLEKELPLLESLGPTPLLAEFHCQLGEVYFNLGRESEAFAELEKSHRLALQLKLLEKIVETGSALALIYWRQNRRLDAKMVCEESAALLRNAGRIEEAADMVGIPGKLAAGIIS